MIKNQKPNNSDKAKPALQAKRYMDTCDSSNELAPRRFPLKVNEMLHSSNANIDNSLHLTKKTNNSSSSIDDNDQTLDSSINGTNNENVKQESNSTDKNIDTNKDNDLLIAVHALGKLKSDSSHIAKTEISEIPEIPSSTSPTSNPLELPKPTIFDKMISHPIISNSINYVLEKTIHSSSNNVIPELNRISKRELPPVFNNNYPNDTKNTNLKRKRSVESIDPLNNEQQSKKIKSNNKNQNQNQNQNQPYLKLKKNIQPNLRQQVSISSALATHKSLQDLKDLSSLNLNIESRKKLTMLIQFLKLGNNQLSERIDKLIQNVDKKREKIEHKNIESRNNSSTSLESDLKIQQIKTEIVNTVKKIVNVVSKVSAQSLSEPARSNVREAILKLPMLLNNEHLIGNNYETDEDTEEEEEDEEQEDNAIDDLSDNDSVTSHYEDSVEQQINSDEENIPTMKVTGKTIFKRTRKPSISRRLLNSLIKYRKTKGDEVEKNTLKVKKWFKEKIKDQIMHDSSGKVLILAQESLDMVNKIIKFCNESLDKADHWNNNRQHQHQIELLNRLQNIKYNDISHLVIDSTDKSSASLNLSKNFNKKQEAVQTITVKDSKQSSTANSSE